MKHSHALRRAAGLLVGTVAVTAATVAVGAPAQAAPLGALTLAPSFGNITTSPAFATATTAKGCPAGFGQNVKMKAGKVGGPYNNIAKAGGAGTYADGSFTLEPDRELTKAITATPANGDYEIVVECLGEQGGQHPDRFVATITVTGQTWAVKGTTPPIDPPPTTPPPTNPPPTTPTTTALAVTPAGPVDRGAAVTLTATVAPAAATGSVRFADGATALGTAPLSAGTATLTTSDLSAGEHVLTAAFVPAEGGTHAASTSTAVTLRVNAPAPGAGTGKQTVTAVVSSEFSLSVAGDAVTLTGGAIGGQATGDLRTAKVTDLRGSNLGWDLTGQVEQFKNTTGGTIAADQLGWAPDVKRVQGSGEGTPGATVAPGSGLGVAKTLCKAAAGKSAGVYDCGAKLTLGIPDTTAPGSYTATLTLTLA